MVAVDDFTSNNGATSIVPDSHLWDATRMPKRNEEMPGVMPTGSIMYFLGTLWHGGGANNSLTSRLALTVQYCQPWIRPFENQILAVGWEKLDSIPSRLVDMLGYKVGQPFMGYVDGRSPLAAVSHLLEQKKKVTLGQGNCKL